MSTELSGAKEYALTDAMNLLTLGEARAIQKHYGEEIGNGLDGLSMAGGVIFCLERRAALREGAAGKPMPTWTDIENLTLDEVNGYFLSEEIEVDASEPETDLGKFVSPAA